MQETATATATAERGGNGRGLFLDELIHLLCRLIRASFTRLAPSCRTAAGGQPDGIGHDSIRTVRAMEFGLLGPFGVLVDGTAVNLATASFDNTVRLWDAETGVEQLILTGATAASSASFAPDGRQILVATSDGAMVFLLDIEEFRDLAYDRLTRWWRAEERLTYLDSETCPPRP